MLRLVLSDVPAASGAAADEALDVFAFFSSAAVWTGLLGERIERERAIRRRRMLSGSIEAGRRCEKLDRVEHAYRIVVARETPVVQRVDRLGIQAEIDLGRRSGRH